MSFRPAALACVILAYSVLPSLAHAADYGIAKEFDWQTRWGKIVTTNPRACHQIGDSQKA